MRTIDIYIFSLIILCVIGLKTLWTPNAKTSQSRLFSVLLILVFIANILDPATFALDGCHGQAMGVFLRAAQTAVYLLQVAVGCLWFYYVYVVIFSNRKIYPKTGFFFAIPAIIGAGLVLANIGTGWVFTYDCKNAYSRGWLSSIDAFTSYLYLVVGFIIAIAHRKNIERRNMVALMLFMLTPTIFGLVQTLVYGSTLIWPGMSISLLIIYIAIQNDLLLLDYATGVNNRRSMDRLLRRKIANARDKISFAMLLVDVDGIASINDRYGHIEGDFAIRTMAKLLENCFMQDGFVARYGGDEFAVLINVGSIGELDGVKERVQAKIDGWNATSDRKWRLSVSMACAPYVNSDRLSADNFFAQVDKLLNADKLVRR
jgi:diguanylate cyclase (GGDEF)-like protein